MKKKSVRIMGILNVTPDSFSDGGKYVDLDLAVNRAKEMLKQGADIIDIGGQSTRPGAVMTTPEEESARVVPVIRAVRKALPNIDISVDTFRASVATLALKSGANMVNSLGGFNFDLEMAGVVAKAKCLIVIYHIKGEPNTMQKGEIVYSDVIREINKFFAEQIRIGAKHGVKKSQFILDPGVGFGKTDKHNLAIIKKFGSFKKFKLPVLIGVSRKSHLGRILQKKLGFKNIPDPAERLEAGLAETAAAVFHGAEIVRTHDVLETKKFLTLLEEVL